MREVDVVVRRMHARQKHPHVEWTANVEMLGTYCTEYGAQLTCVWYASHGPSR